MNRYLERHDGPWHGAALHFRLAADCAWDGRVKRVFKIRFRDDEKV